MSDTSVLRSPHAVASELNISPATLRRWSDEFTDFLSSGAGASKGRSHRRYTENDVATLTLIKELMNSGLTYEQVRFQLNGEAARSVTEPGIVQEPTNELEDNQESTDVNLSAEAGRISSPVDENFDEDGDRALVAAKTEESRAISFLTNTLATLSDSQKSILNSQAANRELLGVLLQDNFNLKEENNRLRERILEVERDVAQNRQEDEWRREALRQELEAKVAAASQLATEAIATARTVETPQIKTVERKPGCLGLLFGLGSTQIITAPQRRKVGASRGGKQPGVPPGMSQQSPAAAASSPQQPPPSHPKPLSPPE